MMKTPTKLSAVGAASLIGLALAAGSLTTGDAQGQILPVSGVGPGAGHTSPTATAPAISTVWKTAAWTSIVAQVARPAAQTLTPHHAGHPQCADASAPRGHPQCADADAPRGDPQCADAGAPRGHVRKRSPHAVMGQRQPLARECTALPCRASFRRRTSSGA